MQIVIDIPEEMHEQIKDGYVPLGISKYLKNGTPLPKGHGRLIDADNVKSHFSDRDGDEFTAFHFYDAVENAHTIIEADKESEDKE